jgi:hypothetical protein
MSKPTHIAYVVADPKEGTDRKAKWREIGAVWPHKSGTGFDLVIYDQLSVSVKHVGAVSAERHPRDARYNFKLMGGWCGQLGRSPHRFATFSPQLIKSLAVLLAARLHFGLSVRSAGAVGLRLFAAGPPQSVLSWHSLRRGDRGFRCHGAAGARRSIRRR